MKQSLYSSILNLLNVYSKNEKGITLYYKISKTTKWIERQLQKDTNDEQVLFEDVSCILHLLQSLIQAEFEGMSREDMMEKRNVQVGEFTILQVLSYGISVVIPLITESMLHYPSLCKDYIYLITEILEYFPDQLASFDSSLLDAIMKSLEFGISQPLYDLGSCALDATSTLGLYIWTEILKKEGESCILYIKPFLGKFLSLIFIKILFHDFDSNLISHAGNALFALALAQSDSFHSLIEQTIASQSSSLAQSRLVKEFQDLSHCIHKVASANSLQIKQGHWMIGFGQSKGIQSLLYFKEFKDVFLSFTLNVRGISKVK